MDSLSNPVPPSVRQAPLSMSFQAKGEFLRIVVAVALAAVGNRSAVVAQRIQIAKNGGPRNIQPLRQVFRLAGGAPTNEGIDTKQEANLFLETHGDSD